MPAKKGTAKKSTSKRASSKRERVVIDVDSDEDAPQPKRTKRPGAASQVSPLELLFERYSAVPSDATMDVDESDGTSIGPSGIEKMCEDIGVGLDDISLLIMAWHLGATRVGYFSREEWMKLSNFGITDLETLKKRVPQFPRDIKEHENAKRLFMFTFNYVKENTETKVIPVELAEGYIRLILPKCVHTESFCQFLTQQKEQPKGYRAMNMDQWKMWFEFAHTMPPDLSLYDETAAWPLLIDNYVIHRKNELANNAMQTSSSTLS